jgi:hypothetical protein
MQLQTLYVTVGFTENLSGGILHGQWPEAGRRFSGKVSIEPYEL